MMTLQDSVAFALERSRNILQLFIADLTPAEFVHRSASKANCAAWIVGHLILSDRRVIQLLGKTDLPPLPDGFEKRFSRDPGSPEAQEFGDAMILPALFDQHRTMLIEAMRKSDVAEWSKPLEKPSPRFATLGEMLTFFSLHTAMHAGQISTIRRSLGKPALF
ncbi:MAG TPA: DinB family protein [Tepidisphaeraceae bacterium]|jgi:hypothetical protein|nr:DinB family protein [Tepidisphaeraceae bacterium]